MRPEEASLESLVLALKGHALQLHKTKERAANLHRNFLTRSPMSWISSMRARLSAAVGSVCIMQPAARFNDGTWTVSLARAHKKAKLQSLFASSEREMVKVCPGKTVPLAAKSSSLRELVKDERYTGVLQQFPQNYFGLCRMPVGSLAYSLTLW